MTTLDRFVHRVDTEPLRVGLIRNDPEAVQVFSDTLRALQTALTGDPLKLATDQELILEIERRGYSVIN